MDYVKAFFVGGIICAAGQLVIDKTKLTPARLLTGYVCSGVFLSLFGIYGKIVKFAGAGATVPLTGFGYALFEGVKKGIKEKGILGIFTGGLSATAGGIAAVIVFALIAAIVSKPKIKYQMLSKRFSGSRKTRLCISLYNAKPCFYLHISGFTFVAETIISISGKALSSVFFSKPRTIFSLSWCLISI